MKTYNISVFTENNIGILNRITIIFTRRHVNIESITASESEVKGVYRYTIVVNVSLDQVRKIVGQIEKQIEVLKAFYHENENVVSRELAIFKVHTGSFIDLKKSESILNNHQAKIIAIEQDYTMIEKTGSPIEIELLYNELNQIEILEFARSGKVAISKPMKTLEEYLKDFQLNN